MKRAVTLKVNGRAHMDVEHRTLLAHALRDDLNLTSTHIGCDTSQCGACTVLIDGRAVKSCTALAVQAQGTEITGHDHDRHGFPQQSPGRPDRRRDPARHRGQLLPLYRLPEHRRRHQGRLHLAGSFGQLVETKGDMAAVEKAAREALEGLEIGGDVHAPAEYRRHLAIVAAKRAVQIAYERAGA